MYDPNDNKYDPDNLQDADIPAGLQPEDDAADPQGANSAASPEDNYAGSDSGFDSPEANYSSSENSFGEPYDSYSRDGFADRGFHYDSEESACRIYSDANFVPANEAPAKPKTYCTANRYERPKKARQRRGVPVGGVIAICLVCALLGGTAGAFVAGGMLDAENPSDTSLSEPTPSPVVTQSTIKNTNNAEALSANEIYDIAVDQNVGIKTEVTMYNWFGQQTSSAVSGSGFIVTSDGYIVTNYHVIETAHEGGYEISVMLYGGETHTAEIVGFDKDNDIAVLKIDAEGLDPVAIGDSDQISVGDKVYAVGNPLGELSYTMTSGMVSALDREIMTESNTVPINMFQIDAAVNSGNSGGPVYNDRGEVIGIVTAKNQGTGVEGLGFAIPINDAVRLVNEIIENGYVSGKASMGITIMDVPSSAILYYNMPNGAYVYYIDPGSCSYAAGLQAGDIITKMGADEISSKNDLTAAKKQYSAGDTTTITVYRSGEYITLEITFDEEIPSAGASIPQESGGNYPYGQGVPNGGY